MNTPSTKAVQLPRIAHYAAVANLIAQIGIIVTGGLVRLTGSGLGCSTWPLCEPGQFAPAFHKEMTYHPIVEFGNRTLTGVLSVIAVILVLTVMKDKAATRSTKRLAWTPIIGIAAQAVIGGITVLLDLHPAIVAVHMIISVALVALSTVLAYRLSPKSRDDVQGLPPLAKRAFLALLLWMIPIVCLGVITTGAGPHSGDNEVGYRFALDPMTVARVHAASVWIFIFILIATGIILFRGKKNPANSTPTTLIRGYWWVVAATLAQGAIGYYQTFNGLPWYVVALHLLGLGIFTMTCTHAYLLSRPAISARAQ